MDIVCALDIHRSQITTKILDLASGEVSRGQIRPVARQPVRAWLQRFAGRDAHVALEGTTGWRFVVEEIARAGHTAHLADPAETAAKRGRKKRAKTDNADCDLLLKLVRSGELPESWIPPDHILELRTRVRARKALLDERTGWQHASRRSCSTRDCRRGSSCERRPAGRHWRRPTCQRPGANSSPSGCT